MRGVDSATILGTCWRGGGGRGEWEDEAGKREESGVTADDPG